MRYVKLKSWIAAAKQFAEKLVVVTSGAEARTEKKGFIAALKALRHPKLSFSANCKAGVMRAHYDMAEAIS